MNSKHRKSPQRRRRDAVQLWAASAVAVGLALTGWGWAGMQPRSPQQAMAISAAGSPAGANPVSGTNPTSVAKTVSTAVYAHRPRYGTKAGTITLPSLKLSWPIYEGTTEKQLSKGVGHFRQSVLPGERDNAVLSGHRATVFNRLGELHKADKIFVKTSAGVFTYRVRSFSVVKRTSRKVIVPTKTAVLTLTTCWPFNHIGKTTQAFIVRADLVASNLTAK